jgi:ferredoxin
MALEIEIDRDLCMGSGNCVFEAPGVFSLDGDSAAVIIDPEASPEDLVFAAARKCPTQAISVKHEGVTLV